MKANLHFKVMFLLSAMSALCQRAFAATDIDVGIGAVEEGDDRMRPALVANTTIADRFGVSVVQYGSKFSIVSQQTTMVALSYRNVVPELSSKFLGYGVGLFGLRELTKLSATANTASKSETLVSYGAYLSLDARLFRMGALTTNLRWDAFLYLPGAATIALSTGRRQVLSLTEGIEL